MDANKLQKFLAHGETAKDAGGMADPFSDPYVLTSLEKHDARFHPNGYKEGDTCKYREALKRGDLADYFLDDVRFDAELEEEKGMGEKKDLAAPTPQDIKDLHEIRDRLEPIARLLNGRVGNFSGLTTSSRWPALNGYPSDFFPTDYAKLSSLEQSSDPAVAKSAADLKEIAMNIVDSEKSGWKKGAGMVPSASDLPPIPSSPSAASPTHSHSPTPNFGADDAKATLLRAAKSVNHHIDKGDFTPNAKAIAALHAAEKDIRALGDKQLEGLMDDVFASEKGGFQTKIGKVPAPSVAWAQAHMPQLPSGGLGGLLGALFGGAVPQPAPQGQATTKKNPWTPFQSPSKYASALAAINANNPAATDPNYWKNKADAMTLQQAVQDMEAKGYIEKNGFRDSYDPNDLDDADLWAGWKPSRNLAKDTATCAAVCFDDLRTRFPNMQWPTNLGVRCGTQPGTGGQSVHSKDDKRHAILFGYLSKPWAGVGLGRQNYGHNTVGQFSYDVLRHEMGHAIMSGELPNGKRKMTLFHDFVTKNYGNPATDLIQYAGKYISSYAVTNKGRGPSMSEMMAEMFSLATSPDYKPGYLPEPVEDFIFKEMLGVQPIP